MKQFLVIQTAFIGDAILASAVLEKLHQHFPKANIDLLVRKGNESLYKEHPFLGNLFVWNKQQGKYKSLLSVSKEIRQQRYDIVINLHRFASSGFITLRSKAKKKVGFDKNPFGFAYSKKVKHEIGNGKHEIERNQALIADITDNKAAKPKLYPSQGDYDKISKYQTEPYVCIAPTSVWFTKELPAEKWISLIKKLNKKVYLLGGPADKKACEEIKQQSKSPTVTNLAGELTLMESAALMNESEMNYVNDSAPLHLASAMDAPVTAFFCSTVPAFGFGPLSTNATVIETKENLDCRPCGLHGYKACPKGHFKCATTISVDELHAN